MADLKVSALVSASIVNSVDYLMLVQGGTSLKVDVSTLALNMPSRINVVEPSEVLAVSGVVATNKLVSKIKALTTPAAYTLAIGTHGMEKYIVCNAVEVTTPTAVLTITGGAGVSTVSFNAIGDSVHLKNIDALWYVVGSNSVVVA